jgi:hypothetical protein
MRAFINADYSSPTGVSADSPIFWIALVNTCLAAIDRRHCLMHLET